MRQRYKERLRKAPRMRVSDIDDDYLGGLGKNGKVIDKL
jgi:hypothetical protein